jgi:hypothetical protein
MSVITNDPDIPNEGKNFISVVMPVYIINSKINQVLQSHNINNLIPNR